ncbi:TIGR01777 family oxidoreductase [Moraxella bovis]|uniref:TIGR01777 family oxidoreductase n=1 Tax=Moraxella bovis TaxID=476 RepID=A0AAQ2Q7E2_MORBO|nr:TIGR01777 family oxidoreductase [Moraxella bovis]AWY19714.1 TIGR01777 family protein [Moraxella bovis]UYZ67923.1 TIGR01777 family oxidoreductase [Moraxella bovis]UYZ70297.1 TIGR01777 family oxidoreductase [Moraxella bovis]UYZ73793.1 TIGR01777 family oxidoreductase [Moraxella bovis]UYZ75163.1 TIGR01777 family oxidoreductase [Moraxella bovis]
MNILITGGSGFLGRQLTLVLLNLGHHIIWVSQNPNRITILNNVKVIDYNALKNLSISIDVIINLAGAGIADKRWSSKQKRRLFDSRINPTLAILNFIKNNPTSLLISGSAIGYYGVSDNATFDENSSPICQDFASELCQTWENLALSTTDISATKVAIIRTGVVLDPKGGIMTRLLPAFKMGLGGRLGDGKQILSFISMSDWVRAVLFIIAKNKSDDLPIHQFYNLTSPNPITNADFTKAIGQLLNKPTLFHLPSWFLRLLLGEMATLLIDGQKVFPNQLLSMGFEFQDKNIYFLENKL